MLCSLVRSGWTSRRNSMGRPSRPLEVTGEDVGSPRTIAAASGNNVWKELFLLDQDKLNRKRHRKEIPNEDDMLAQREARAAAALVREGLLAIQACAAPLDQPPVPHTPQSLSASEVRTPPSTKILWRRETQGPPAHASFNGRTASGAAGERSHREHPTCTVA